MVFVYTRVYTHIYTQTCSKNYIYKYRSTSSIFLKKSSRTTKFQLFLFFSKADVTPSSPPSFSTPVAASSLAGHWFLELAFTWHQTLNRYPLGGCNLEGTQGKQALEVVIFFLQVGVVLEWAGFGEYHDPETWGGEGGGYGGREEGCTTQFGPCSEEWVDAFYVPS